MADQFTSGTITFSGTNNTNLETADSRWSKLPGVTSSAVVYNGRLAASSTSSGPGYRYNGESPPSADYSVRCDLTMIGQNASYSSGPMLRAADNGASRDGYWFRHKHGTGWQVFRYLAGAATQIGGTIAATYATGRTYTVEATVVGDTVQLAVEDMVILTATDASPLTAAGKIGVQPVSTTTAGEHLDNLEGWATDGLVTYPGSTQVLADAAWTWFSGPEAVSYNGYTYLGYITSAGDVAIAKINESTLATTSTVLHAALEVDDHDNPSVTIRPDGRILVMYSIHNDPSGTRRRISTNAEDITAWGSEAVISSGITTPCSYANTYRLSQSGKIYDFFRSGQGGVGTNPWVVITSSDEGDTWSGQTSILTETNERPYPVFWSNGVDRIDMLYNNGPPEEVVSSVYHAYAKLDGSNNLLWYKTDGTLIGSAISPASAGSLVYDGTTDESWVWDVITGPDGYPWALWVKFLGGTTNHRVMFSRWTGSAWSTPVDICKAGIAWATGDPNYSPGARFDTVDPTHIYVGRLTEAGAAPFEYATADGGATWTKLRQLAEGGTGKWMRPISPVNRAANVAAIFATGTYTSYTSYSMVARVFAAAAQSGEIAASGVAQAAGAGTLAANVSVAAVGVSLAGGAAAASASIPLSAVGLSVSGGAATPVATVTISAAGLAEAAGIASGAVEGPGSISASGSAVAGGSGALAVTIHLVATGAAQAGGDAPVATTVTLTAAGLAQALGQGGLSIQIPLAAAGAAQAGGAASLSLGAGIVLVRDARYVVSNARALRVSGSTHAR